MQHPHPSDLPSSLPFKLPAPSVGAVLTFVLSIAIALLTGAWHSKESVSDHNADMAQVHSELTRILDVLCEEKPAARQCLERGGEVSAR